MDWIKRCIWFHDKRPPRDLRANKPFVVGADVAHVRAAAFGTGQLASTLRVAKSTTETLPGPPFTPWILCEPRFRYFGGGTEPL